MLLSSFASPTTEFFRVFAIAAQNVRECALAGAAPLGAPVKKPPVEKSGQ